MPLPNFLIHLSSRVFFPHHPNAGALLPGLSNKSSSSPSDFSPWVFGSRPWLFDCRVLGSLPWLLHSFAFHSNEPASFCFSFFAHHFLCIVSTFYPCRSHSATTAWQLLRDFQHPHFLRHLCAPNHFPIFLLQAFATDHIFMHSFHLNSVWAFRSASGNFSAAGTRKMMALALNHFLWTKGFTNGREEGGGRGRGRGQSWTIIANATGHSRPSSVRVPRASTLQISHVATDVRFANAPSRRWPETRSHFIKTSHVVLAPNIGCSNFRSAATNAGVHGNRHHVLFWLLERVLRFSGNVHFKFVFPTGHNTHRVK